MKKLLKRKETTVALLIVILTLAVALRAPGFIQPKSLANIVVDTCILIIVSIGQLGVILIGGIDISVGSTMALVGMAAAMLNQFNPGVPAWIYAPFSVVMGAALGSIGGVLVGFGRLPPLIASLGMMSAYRGLVFLLSKGQWVTANEMTEGFRKIPEGLWLGAPHMLWAALAVGVFAQLFMRHTRSGRDVYAIGGNPTAARFAGVSQRKVEINVFVISGALAGLAGLLYVSRYGIAQNETATGFEMQTVAAAVLGGVNIAGGSGTVPGVILGALFLGVVNNALPVLRMSPFLQMAIQGFIILMAVVANTVVDRRNKRAFKAGRAR
ncbi:ABC transporter permease [bacterium]|nr:ABC transporter permease [bacterium]